jgi:hypothetical protein
MMTGRGALGARANKEEEKQTAAPAPEPPKPPTFSKALQHLCDLLAEHDEEDLAGEIDDELRRALEDLKKALAGRDAEKDDRSRGRMKPDRDEAHPVDSKRGGAPEIVEHIWHVCQDLYQRPTKIVFSSDDGQLWTVSLGDEADEEMALGMTAAAGSAELLEGLMDELERRAQKLMERIASSKGLVAQYRDEEVD